MPKMQRAPSAKRCGAPLRSSRHTLVDTRLIVMRQRYYDPIDRVALLMPDTDGDFSLVVDGRVRDSPAKLVEFLRDRAGETSGRNRNRHQAPGAFRCVRSRGRRYQPRDQDLARPRSQLRHGSDVKSSFTLCGDGPGHRPVAIDCVYWPDRCLSQYIFEVVATD